MEASVKKTYTLELTAEEWIILLLAISFTLGRATGRETPVPSLNGNEVAQLQQINRTLIALEEEGD